MKPLRGPQFDPYRIKIPEIMKRMNPGAVENDHNGAFVYTLGGNTLRVIAASGGGWDHVSVSLEHRAPTWEEMEYIKRIFFKDDEVAMQLHVSTRDHISCHPHTLHIWRPLKAKIPLPPKSYV